MTGDDEVFLVQGPIVPGLQAVLDAVAQDWGALAVLGDDGLIPWTGDITPWLEEGEIALCRDEAMDAMWDELGYHVRDGAGPFALFFRPLAVNPLAITTTEDPYAHNVPGKFEPYDITLVGSDLWPITLVTGDAESEFAARLRSLICSVFAGDQPV